MVKTVLIRILHEDAILIKDSCTKDFLSHHPEYEATPLSYLKMVHEIVKFYIEH